jgi:phosphoglycerate dehydrogenase-like enzyme
VAIVELTLESERARTVDRYVVVKVADSLTSSRDIEAKVLGPIASLDSITCAKEEELQGSHIENADAILLSHTMQLSNRTIQSLKKCKVIVCCSVGYNNVDLEFTGRRGIYVCNVPDYCVDEVSDYAIGLMIALNRKIPQLDKSVKERKWDWTIARPTMRFRDKTLGIVGLGRIGTATALKGKALGFRVIEYDPYLRPGQEKAIGAEAVDLDTLLRDSDVISLHVPLTEETRHMFDEVKLKKMRKTALLINTSRGAVVEAQALVKALREKWIAGAALDVLETEPPDSHNPLLDSDNVILTPHAAFYSEESLIELGEKGAEEVARVLRGETPRNAVNLLWLKA